MPVVPSRGAPDPLPLLEQRYGPKGGWSLERWNDVLDLLMQHRSIRNYLPDKLPEGVLELAIAAAQSASTSSNLQAWSVLAVEDADRKARLAALCGAQKHITDAPLFLVWLADLSRVVRVAERRNAELGALPFIEPFVIAVIDAALAAQNAVIAFESLGLGTCYIGGIRNNIEEVALELALPPHVTPVFGMTIGVPDPAGNAQIKPRLPQNAVLHREIYAVDEEAAAISEYDERVQQFFASQGQDHAIWSQQACARLKSVRSLHGRDRLRDALLKFGFGLK